MELTVELNYNHGKLTWVLPAWPKVDSLKYGLSGDIRICNTSLVMSSSLNASFKQSDCNMKSSILVYNSKLRVVFISDQSLNIFCLDFKC